MKAVSSNIIERKNLNRLFEIIDDLSREERDFLYSLIEKHQIVHGPRRVYLNPSDWQYSSIHRFIQKDMLKKHWGCNDDFSLFHFGEKK